jgi:hypothetical protein
MEYICGPKQDRRKLTIELPNDVQNIGVLVNGSIPSTLLYHLLLTEKYYTGSQHVIKPFLIKKNRKELDLSTDIIVSQVLQKFPEEKNRYPIVIDSSLTLNVDLVVSGIDQILRLARMDIVYLGTRQKLPKFGLDKYEYQNLSFIKYPFKDINGSHIIDLYHQVFMEDLLNYTHSCQLNKTLHCGNCDGCRERFWSFEQLGKNDNRFFAD